MERGPPKRLIDKKQAIRQLLHASIRMTLWEEDPFATHLIVHSCDKLLTDCLKGGGFDYDMFDVVVPEHKRAFINIFRETYNFLKHADKDHDRLHGVYNIVETNELVTLLNITRFYKYSSEFTNHMRFMIGYLISAYPGSITDGARLQYEQLIYSFKGQTRREAIHFVRQAAEIDEKFQLEKSEDLRDISTTAMKRIPLSP